MYWNTKKYKDLELLVLKREQFLYLTLLTTKLSHFHINGYIKY